MKKEDFNKNSIVVGCNYHTTWQSHHNMRFVLKAVDGDTATLITRRTHRTIQTHIDTLIFIESNHNKNKAMKILSKEKKDGP